MNTTTATLTVTRHNGHLFKSARVLARSQHPGLPGNRDRLDLVHQRILF